MDASASIGSMIALGNLLLSQESLDQTVLPLVTECLSNVNVHFRAQKRYTLLLTAAKLVSAQILITFDFFSYL